MIGIYSQVSTINIRFKTLTCSNSPMETAEKDLKYVQSLQNKKPEGRHWRRCGVFIVSFEHI